MPTAWRWLVRTFALWLLLGSTSADARVRRTMVVSHAASLEARRDAKAHVEHTFVVSQKYQSRLRIELVGLPESPVEPPRLRGASAEGEPIELELEQTPDPGVVYLTTPEKALARRGTYTIQLSYGVDLAQAGALERSGARTRLAWRVPALADGVDGVALTIDVPHGMSPPEAADELTAAVITGVERQAAIDRVRMVRAHVSPGEPVTLALSVEAAAFSLPSSNAPALASAKHVDRAMERASVHQDAGGAAARRLLLVFVLTILAALVVAAGVWLERRRVDRALWTVGPLVRPLGRVARPVVVGFVMAGTWLLTGQRPWGAMLCFGLAVLFGMRRIARRRQTADRGTWLVLSAKDAFARQRAREALVDMTTPSGALLATAWVVGVVLAPLGAAAIVPFARHATIAVGLALLPSVFVATGAAAWRRARRRGSDLLMAMHASSGQHGDWRVSPWSRIDAKTGAPSESRVLIRPKTPLPGTLGIEVGFVERAFGAWGDALLEALVRVRDGSPADRKASVSGLATSPTFGRQADERVLRIQIPAYDVGSALDVVRSIAGRFVERRVADAPIAGPDRRRFAEPPEDSAAAASQPA